MPEIERFRRRRLPHWDRPGAIYFVTACLSGSIPAQGLLDLSKYRAELKARPRPAEMSKEEWEFRKHKLHFRRAEEWLDQHAVVRHLERADLANIAVDSLRHFDGSRCVTFAYAIMPSHLHWVFKPLEDWVATLDPEDEKSPRERIMHSVKRYTAAECNQLLARTGTFWQDESYDHCVLDDEELGRIVEYVEMNPVKAGIVERPEEWMFSSRRQRLASGLPVTLPLPAMAG
jgi:type I restriction enzyme R subunit